MNINYDFYPDLMVRTPTRPFSDYHPDKLNLVLLDEDFQRALFLASPDLFSALSDGHFILHKLSKKLQLAVFKYYNRISFRPTPFGVFASVSLTHWSKGNEKLIREENVELLTFKAFGKFETIGGLNYNKELVWANSSIFQVGNQLRFTHRQNSANIGRDSFRTASIELTTPLTKLIEKLSRPVGYQTALDFLCKELHVQDAANQLDQLILAQVLHASSLVRVTGEFPKVMGEINSDNSKDYTLAYHHQRGSMSENYQSDILDAVFALDHLCSNYPNNLTDFVQRFLSKFENTQVPLLKALDPQLGLSYLGTERTSSQDIGQSGTEGALENKDGHLWTSISSLLLNKISATGNDMVNPISFKEAELTKLKKSSDVNFLNAPSMSVMFRITDVGSVLIEYAGGSSALNIAGRFSHQSEISKVLKDVAAFEDQQNPNVIFAEIVASDGSATDNINSRAHLRGYEIPVLIQSSLKDEHQIKLNDLMLQVINGKMVLFSNRLKKVVIPRLGSAYNYQLSSLPIFRFLADLQHQALSNMTSFDPEHYLPGLPYYPRITYKNTILSPAKWIWNHEVLSEFQSATTSVAAFKRQAHSCGLTAVFAVTSHDRQLVFDLNCELSINYFLQVIAGDKMVLLTEYFLPKQHGCVLNNAGASYAGQFVAFLLNRKTVYLGEALENLSLDKKMSQMFMPGEDWLYFKIYGHPQTINTLLADPQLQMLLSDLVNQKHIVKWFFVRYEDPENHLRLRMKCEGNVQMEITNRVSAWIKDFMKIGLVTDFVIGTYKPELHRYAFAGIDLIETIFYRSSQVVLDFYSERSDYDKLLCFAIASISEILAIWYVKIDDRIAFVEAYLSGVLFDKTTKIGLDSYYRKHRFLLDEGFANIGNDCSQRFAFRESLQSLICIQSESEFHVLAADLIHMHVNRINSTGSAALESKIYYVLKKSLRSVKAKSQKLFLA